MGRPLETLLRRVGRATPSSSLLLIVLGVAVLQSRPEAPRVHEGRATPTTSQDGQTVLDVVRMAAEPVTGNADDFDQLLSLIGDARFVLLGEATHGTHEFYATRAAITRRLIEEKGFGAVAIEGNWTNATRVDRYTRGTSTDESAEQALADFVNFPRWMWRNTDVRDLVEWLRVYNLRQPPSHQAGFYGLDLYGLFASVDATIRDLELVAPWSAERARERYRCFAQYDYDPQRYGGQAGDEHASCQDEAEAQLQEIQHIANEPRLPLPREKQAALFSALQNARVVKNGEAYFRTLYQGSDSTWNMRDRHMVDTLQEVANYHNTAERAGKVVAWAHNTHMGDVRATQFWKDGQLHVGQMMR
ncbi:MAG: Erythromycin esterase homolog, partial [uncultured Chloroflexia bacterium]